MCIRDRYTQLLSNVLAHSADELSLISSIELCTVTNLPYLTFEESNIEIDLGLQSYWPDRATPTKLYQTMKAKRTLKESYIIILQTFRCSWVVNIIWHQTTRRNRWRVKTQHCRSIHVHDDVVAMSLSSMQSHTGWLPGSILLRATAECFARHSHSLNVCTSVCLSVTLVSCINTGAR